ncbi:MAG: formimidoylglutamase [Algibacter sp.]|uniref:formimidoylglutamase n=1 Tax=Algibacter sp. TaxID=1872428 RepID=UPI002615322B|nr:formimidoylglutamase [Algibacter sp.]MDG1728708.1 formimidoylglutamase [Algibacter sp.]MDG2178767.1 formimidoylglutamase [Algibacter sp.]
MDKLVLFNNTTCNKLLNKRSGESKFGQYVQILTGISNIYEQLENLDVTHVILGLPEDVGVFANHGKTGTSKAWEATLKVLLNIQSNNFTRASKVLILGHFDFTEEQLAVSKLNASRKKDVLKARKIVTKIDEYVTHIIHQIVMTGKKPILIGGGHNNAYGNIKGASLAVGTPINVINFDVNSGLRDDEGRHSRNGFSYALAEGFLGNYFVFGLHENDTSDKIFKALDKSKFIEYNTFDALEIRKDLKFKKELERAITHVSDSNFGIEIDCNAIENIPSSAMTPSGFSVNKTRQFINFFAKHKNTTYLHICEAAPTKKTANQVGKLITYLITDFIKAHDE